MGVGHIIGIVFFVAALTTNIIAIATPGWLYSASIAAGLFEAVSGSSAVEFVSAAAEYVAFAFSIIADVLLVVAIVAAAVASATDPVGLVEKLAGVVGILAAVSIMIGMAVYTGMRIAAVDFLFISWGYSFALGWTSFCLALIGGIVALI